MIDASVGEAMNEPRIAVIRKHDRFVGGEQRVEVSMRESMGRLSLSCSRIKSTTLMTRIFSSGRCRLNKSTAASLSNVGTSPAQPITTSGSAPLSLLCRGIARPAVCLPR